MRSGWTARMAARSHCRRAWIRAGRVGRVACRVVELADAVAQARNALERARVHRLGLLADNGPEWIIADLAAEAANVPLVPLPSFFSPAQLQHALDTAGVDTLLCANGTAAQKLGFVPADSLAGTSLTIAQRTLANRLLLPGGTTKITFTSGTTGNPKGVCLGSAQQWAVARAIGSATRGLGLARHLCLLPLPVLLENVAGVYAALLEGATCIVPPLGEVGLTGSSQFDAAVCLAAIARAQANSVILLPQMLRALLGTIAAGHPLPASLRFVAVGGGRVAPALLAQARALGVPAYEGYGLSECASVVALNLPGAQRPGSVGKPLAHVRVRVSGWGEIEVAGNNYLGYLGDGAAARGEWLATGDLGHLDDDGFVHIDGRRRNLIITSFGRNVSPEWPEAELLAGPTIAQAAVFGEARAQLCAVLVPTAANMPDAALQAQVERCQPAPAGLCAGRCMGSRHSTFLLRQQSGDRQRTRSARRRAGAIRHATRRRLPETRWSLIRCRSLTPCRPRRWPNVPHCSRHR